MKNNTKKDSSQTIALAHKGHADAYRQNKQFKRSIDRYKLALSFKPDYWQAHANLSLVFETTNNLTNAIFHASKALEIKQIAELYDNLGRILFKANNFSESIRNHINAIKLMPDLISAHLNLANALKNNGETNKAIHYYQQAISIDPLFREAYISLGTILKQNGKIEDAITSYKKALEIFPKDISTISNIFICYRILCDWKNAELMSCNISSIRNTENILPNINSSLFTPPFINLYRYKSGIDSRTLLNEAIQWNKYNSENQNNISATHLHQSPHRNKVRVGYISHDFRKHPVGILVQNLFKHHDNKTFEIYIYSYGPDTNDTYRASIINSTENFIELRHLDDLAAATKIANDEIDILVDLTGFTAGGRNKICAYKPAPIQVNYLGYPGSSGASYFDYIIVDKVLAPYQYECYYSEKLIRLPNCYQVNSQQITPSTKEYSRSEFDLPDDDIVFCCFNDTKKIEPSTFNSWMNILTKVKGSVLWLIATKDLQKKNIRQEAKKMDVNPDRVIFANKMPLSEHLKRHELADIALDTFHYSGGITTSISLMANVPVVTLPEEIYSSRMSASILASVSLQELITNSFDQYEKKSIELALNKNLLHKIKQCLAINYSSGPLFDTAQFTKNLEFSYRKILNNHLNGNPPKHYNI